MIVGDNGVSWLDDEGNPDQHTHKVETLEWLIKWRERIGGRNVDAFKRVRQPGCDPFISGKLSMMVNIATTTPRFGTTASTSMWAMRLFLSGNLVRAAGAGAAVSSWRSPTAPSMRKKPLSSSSGHAAQKHSAIGLL